jgi:cobalt-zinc-cadmium efflux system membrane fusion protein
MTRWSALLSSILLAAACGRGDEDEGAKPPPRVKGHAIVLDDKSRAALDLAVAPAAEGELPDIRIRYGRVIARPGDEMLVASPINGRVAEVGSVTIGDRVTAGTVLAKVSAVLAATERAAAGVQSAEIGAQVAQAQQEVKLREAELVRATDLARDGIISQAKLQEAEAAAANARARLAAARQGREAQAGALGGATTLKAPADGTLVSLDAAVGAGVETGRTVARILRAGPRRIDLAVSASDPTASAYEVNVGDRWVPARLVSRGTAVGDDGNRHDLLELDAGAEPLLGSTVAVRLAASAARGIVVPESAVLTSASGDVVYIEEKPGSFEPRLVRVAARFGGKARIESGLKSGERVVTRGASALRGEALRSSLGGDGDG